MFKQQLAETDHQHRDVIIKITFLLLSCVLATSNAKINVEKRILYGRPVMQYEVRNSECGRFQDTAFARKTVNLLFICKI